MTVYICLLIFLLLLGILKSKSVYGSSVDRFVTAIGCFALFVFAAVRASNVGADTSQYISHFVKLNTTKLADLSTYKNGYYGDVAIGYKLYNKLIAFFADSPQTITVVNSLVLIVLIYKLIEKQSENKWLSLLLYYTFCFYQLALNLTLSSIVSYFMLLIIPTIEDKKWMRYLLFVGIGMSFHTSAIFFLPLYFLRKYELTFKRFFLIVLCAIVGGVFYSQTIRMIIRILPSEYQVYVSMNTVHQQLGVELLVYMVQLLAIALCLVFIEKDRRYRFMKENRLMCWYFLIETIAYIFGIQAEGFARGAFLFSPYVIITIPKIISYTSSERKKRIITGYIILYALIIYFARISVNNVGITMPYKFFG